MSERYSERQDRLASQLSSYVKDQFVNCQNRANIPYDVVNEFIGDGDSPDANKIIRKAQAEVKKEFPNAKYHYHGLDAGVFTNDSPETKTRSFYTTPKLFQGLLPRVLLMLLIVVIPALVCIALMEGSWQVIMH